MKLEELRRRLASIDRRIVELAAERCRVASAIGEEKRRLGLPTRDFRQEREVIERARRAAAELGVDAALAEELALSLIRGALTVQEKERLAASGGGSGKRALVIGGSGKMGRWFVRFLSSQGFELAVADPAGDATEGARRYEDWTAAPLDEEVIVVATPLSVSNAILHGLAARRPAGLVFDIGSLKTPLRSGLEALARAGVRVTSVHPMFGPDTELLSGRHVIFVDVGVAEATAAARELFASTMARLVDMDLESHDRLMAYVLGLSHALNIAFFTALAESGEAAPRLATLSSTTFDEQLEVARRVAAENPHLYFEIQAANAYGAEALDALAEAVARLRAIVGAGNEEAFVELMRRGRAYLEGRGRR